MYNITFWHRSVSTLTDVLISVFLHINRYAGIAISEHCSFLQAFTCSLQRRRRTLTDELQRSLFSSHFYGKKCKLSPWQRNALLWVLSSPSYFHFNSALQEHTGCKAHDVQNMTGCTLWTARGVRSSVARQLNGDVDLNAALGVKLDYMCPQVHILTKYTDVWCPVNENS